MTYFNAPFNYPLNIVCFHTSTETSKKNASSVVKPQSTASLAGNHSSTIDTSTGIITLPNTQCMLIGTINYLSTVNYNYARYRWYDTTNSQFIGSIGQIRGPDANRHNAYISNPISCDEEAVAIAQNINVKLVITAVSTNNTITLDSDYQNYQRFSGKTKLIVFEF